MVSDPCTKFHQNFSFYRQIKLMTLLDRTMTFCSTLCLYEGKAIRSSICTLNRSGLQHTHTQFKNPFQFWAPLVLIWAPLVLIPAFQNTWAQKVELEGKMHIILPCNWPKIFNQALAKMWFPQTLGRWNSLKISQDPSSIYATKNLKEEQRLGKELAKREI